MMSPAQLLTGGYNTLYGGATFYDGPDLNFVFDNGSTLDTRWLAIYNPTDYTGPLTTGGDYYNFFVLGIQPASYNESNLPCTFQDDGCGSGTGKPQPSYSFDAGWNEWTGGEYPPADITQDELASIGWVTGYYLDDISTGVLSLPSFEQSSLAVLNFSTAVNDFIRGAKERSTSKIIIDLQGNSGGAILLALSTFYSFFPGKEVFRGSRRRSHPLADVLGTTLTNYWDNLPPTQDNFTMFASNEWVVTDRLNAENGRNFTSWAEYYGPRSEMGDNFSLVVSINLIRRFCYCRLIINNVQERYDLNNSVFEGSIFNGWQLNGSRNGLEAPWSADDIVIVSSFTPPCKLLFC
jgi:hypothetical protein